MIANEMLLKCGSLGADPKAADKPPIIPMLLTAVTITKPCLLIQPDY